MKETPAIRVAIADDHPIVRRSLRYYLQEQEGIAVVGEAGTGRQAMDLLRTGGVDVLLLDLDMPGQSGLDVLPRIRAKAPGRPGIVVLSAYPDEAYAVPLIRHGAGAYLNKACEPEEIVRAIRRVAEGGRYVTPAVAQRLAAHLTAPAPASAHQRLTTRELQVLLKLAQGHTAREAAAQLSLSTKTVGSYRARLLRKLGARTVAELTYYALKEGLLN